jgi:hypothetical protein
MLVAALSLTASACLADAGGADEAVGAAAEAQVDPASKDFLVYTLTQSGVQVGQLLVTNTTGGGFTAGREYWYMTQNVSMGASLTFTSGAAQWWSTPPSGLGTLSFTMAQRPSWTSAGGIRGTLLKYVVAPTGEGVMIDWNMTQSGGAWSGNIVWYHTTTGNVFGASQADTLSPTTSYPGTWYYYVANPL